MSLLLDQDFFEPGCSKMMMLFLRRTLVLSEKNSAKIVSYATNYKKPKIIFFIASTICV